MCSATAMRLELLLSVSRRQWPAGFLDTHGHTLYAHSVKGMWVGGLVGPAVLLG